MHVDLEVLALFKRARKGESASHPPRSEPPAGEAHQNRFSHLAPEGPACCQAENQFSSSRLGHSHCRGWVLQTFAGRVCKPHPEAGLEADPIQSSPGSHVKGLGWTHLSVMPWNQAARTHHEEASAPGSSTDRKLRVLLILPRQLCSPTTLKTHFLLKPMRASAFQDSFISRPERTL